MNAAIIPTTAYLSSGIESLQDMVWLNYIMLSQVSCRSRNFEDLNVGAGEEAEAVYEHSLRVTSMGEG